MKFHTVIIIYNPNSTGDSQKNADAFAKELKELSADLEIKTVATKFAGHADELAAKYGSDESSVIISSSGDGGYNEVVNGILKSAGKAAVAVLPSGNANDHHTAAGSSDLAGSIVNGRDETIELILVSTTQNGRPWKRYAHSYVGLGLTPKVGKALTELRPNIVTEKWYVIKHLLTFKHITISIDGTKQRYNNLLFATIDRMSKVVKLDEDASLNDGKLEVYETRYVSLVGMLKTLITVGIHGIQKVAQVSEYTFETIRPTLIQLDGEVFKIDSQSKVTVVCQKNALRTIR